MKWKCSKSRYLEFYQLILNELQYLLLHQNAIQEARRITNSQAEIGISFVIVSKRINTRFFALDRSGQYINPAVGTAVDNVVTLPERFDFFLVSQNTNQGTVSPTSYNIIRNTANIGADIHQKLAYFMTHLYYNWAVSNFN